VSHDDPHLTIEQFSELINERLTPQEHAQAEEHLQRCAPCQEELTDLRRVVAMLRALPHPEPPRSFALPADTKVTPLVAVASRPSRLRAAGRAISLLAAVVGIALLISSIVNTPSGGAATGVSSASGSVSPQARHSGIQPFTPSTRTNSPSVVPHTATPQPAQTSPVQHLSLPDLRSATERAIFGILLLIIGLAGALILWRRRYSLP
jgi:anti-sigma factor RsiW